MQCKNSVASIELRIRSAHVVSTGTVEGPTTEIPIIFDPGLDKKKAEEECDFPPVVFRKWATQGERKLTKGR